MDTEAFVPGDLLKHPQYLDAIYLVALGQHTPLVLVIIRMYNRGGAPFGICATGEGTIHDWSSDAGLKKQGFVKIGHLSLLDVKVDK